MTAISLPAVGKWVFVFVVAQWLSVPEASRSAMIALIILMVVDFVTGLCSAFINKTLASAVNARALIRKGLIFLILLTAHVMERLAGIELHLEFAGAAGFAINEGIAILENCALCGVWIPASLVDALIKVKNIRGEGATEEQLAQLRGRTRAMAASAGASSDQMHQLREDQTAGVVRENE